ncbi:MAG: sensor histidine kinase [Rhodospirillaceae bacterium]|nr:sensor histidine kinase [Rhodospirillales bacterium]
MTIGFRARRISGILILSLMLALWLQLWAAYRSEVEHAGLLVESMVHAIAQQITGSLDGVDQILVGMTDLVHSGQWDNPEQRERLHSRMRAFPEILYVAVVDGNGRMRANTLPSIDLPPEGLDVTHRDYVTILDTMPGGKARVGLPIIGRQTGERTIPLSRPLLDGEGRRQGTVVAMVSADHYADILSSNVLDAEGASAIIRLDGLFLARSPAQAEKFGTSIAGSELLTQWVTNAPVGVAQLVAKADGNRKFIGYRVLADYPLVMTSGLSENKALKSWRSMMATELAAALVLSILIFQWGWQTDRREAELLDHQLELEAKVQERTSLLSAATQLAEARAARISAINTTLSGLAQVAAHQLQEPLRPIVSFTQLARRSLAGSNPVVDQHLSYVETAGFKLKAILVAFQGYTELLGGTPQRRDIDLSGLVAHLTASLADQLAGAHAELHVGALPHITADVNMIEVALRELVTNSITFRHPDRPLRIDISGSIDAECWRIVVADNGIGVSDSIRPRLFEAFARHHKDASGATGLGLATCQAIAEAHGGGVTLESSTAGSAFTLTLPRG